MVPAKTLGLQDAAAGANRKEHKAVSALQHAGCGWNPSFKTFCRHSSSMALFGQGLR